MSAYTQVLEKLNSLTNWANSVIANAKKIYEFTHQTSLNTDSEVAAFNPSNNEIEKIKVSQIVENGLSNIPKSNSISSNSSVTVATSLAIKTVNDKVNANSSDITTLETSKIAITDIVNNLTSIATNKPLSALQGKVLKQLIDNINALLLSDDTTLDEIQEIVDYIKQNKEELENLGIANISGLQTALNNLTNSINAINLELDTKVDKVIGMGLSSNNFTDYYKSKLSGIAAGAEVNVQSDWNATSGDALIKNKPNIPTQTFVDAALSSTSTNPVQNKVVNSALNTKENTFTKNTAFNKSFGTSSNTVAQGNDSRINNGQTAYSWGNHASVGYLTSLPSHTHTWAQITGKPTTFSPSPHNHDDRYYTETESNNRYLGKTSKATDSNLLDGIDSSGFCKTGARNDNYVWIRRSTGTGSSPLYITQQSSGEIVRFYQGSGDGSLKSAIQSGGHLAMYSGSRIRRYSHVGGYLEGSYNTVGANSTKSNPIYTIGSSYVPTDSALGNMYGIGYSNSGASFLNSTDLGSTPSGWGLYVASDGNARIFLEASTGKGHFKSLVTASGFKTPSGTSKQYLMADGSVSTGSTGSLPYTVITGLITQSGSSFPTVIILENTTGQTISGQGVLSSGDGGCTISFSGSLFSDSSKVYFSLTNNIDYNSTRILRMDIHSSSSMIFKGYQNGLGTRGLFSKVPFEIRIYNVALP